MEHKIVVSIVELLTKYMRRNDSSFKILEKIETNALSEFHQWADGKPCKGAFRIQDSEKNILWILFIGWKWERPEDYYITIFPDPPKGPIAEIHKIIDENNESVLYWKYSPSKHDDKNDQRRAYFNEVFLSLDVFISIPTRLDQIDDFLSELFSLAESRLKADKLDIIRPFLRDGFPEGKLKERLHYARERNNEVVRQAKAQAMSEVGSLNCVCCGFDFFKFYGELGKGFIEAHHTRPISELHEDGDITKIEDLALVCSNCHRMLHRKRPWLGLDDLSSLLCSR